MVYVIIGEVGSANHDLYSANRVTINSFYLLYLYFSAAITSMINKEK